MNLYLSGISSPLGPLFLVTDAQQRVRALDFADHEARMRRLLSEHYGDYSMMHHPAPAAISLALRSYFGGELAALNVIQTRTGGSPLQRQVWAALRRIPAGETHSYSALAHALGFEDPRAAIEIGAANGANPVAIIVPCHRVIGKDGGLRGYAGGLHRKKWLLEHEGTFPQRRDTSAVLRLPGI